MAKVFTIKKLRYENFLKRFSSCKIPKIVRPEITVFIRLLKNF